MHLAFDIFQGMGIAAAVGISPFLPAALVGALAAASVEIHFNHTGYGFLQSAAFLLACVAAGFLLAIAERRFGHHRFEQGPVAIALGILTLAIGALLFAGSLARGHYAAWPGLIGGVICAAIGIAATRPLFVRVRARLDPEAAAALPLYAVGIGLVFAALSVVAPPLGLIGVISLAWLIAAGRRREGQKYAGLRILR